MSALVLLVATHSAVAVYNLVQRARCAAAVFMPAALRRGSGVAEGQRRGSAPPAHLSRRPRLPLSYSHAAALRRGGGVAVLLRLFFLANLHSRRRWRRRASCGMLYTPAALWVAMRSTRADVDGVQEMRRQGWRDEEEGETDEWSPCHFSPWVATLAYDT
uniref:Uncharacterized protein n=1 Tax=Oryza rufipogon TaxID=4529 RepID=A0A0E0P6G1_ORYRU